MRSGVDGDIMESFDTTAADPFKLALVIHILLYIPIDFIVMRNMLLVACRLPEELPYVQHFIITFSVLALAVFFVLIFEYAGMPLSFLEAFF